MKRSFFFYSLAVTRFDRGTENFWFRKNVSMGKSILDAKEVFYKSSNEGLFALRKFTKSWYLQCLVVVLLADFYNANKLPYVYFNGYNICSRIKAFFKVLHVCDLYEH